MIIKTLVENTASSKDFKSTHGLSLYVETKAHKILFDLGPGKLFLENANKLNVPIEEIDTVVISHGHYDHGGALKEFLKVNNKAKIYLQETAFQPYYSNAFFLKVYIGLDASLKENERFILTKGLFPIDDELQLFSDISEHRFNTGASKRLLKKVGNRYEPDTFDHEQNLLVKENNSFYLFAGCAHNGIVNIIDKAEQIAGKEMKHVIGGFHLFRLNLEKEDNKKIINDLAALLKEKKTLYYTCHCTGEKPYQILHELIGEQMNYLSTGSVLDIKMSEN